MDELGSGRLGRHSEVEHRAARDVKVHSDLENAADNATKRSQ
jgi:hypothetical protein